MPVRPARQGDRQYDLATGRFLTVDPIDGGSLNNYEYAGQDPINQFDLNGECWNHFGWVCTAGSGIKRGAAAAGRCSALLEEDRDVHGSIHDHVWNSCCGWRSWGVAGRTASRLIARRWATVACTSSWILV